MLRSGNGPPRRPEPAGRRIASGGNRMAPRFGRRGWTVPVQGWFRRVHRSRALATGRHASRNDALILCGVFADRRLVTWRESRRVSGWGGAPVHGHRAAGRPRPGRRFV